MKLIVEPEGGIGPVLSAIAHAKTAIDIVIFRLDCRSVTHALEAAVGRGVAVRAMIARKHKGSSRDLRKLERRLLRSGAVLSRTAGDLVRYHGKMMIVDRRMLHVYGFNYTDRDYRSRSFGIETTDRALVRDAQELFDADATRRPYRSRSGALVVSPDNSRQRLSDFIQGARRQILIYDPRLSDTSMHRLLTERSDHGLDVRIIGKTRRLTSALRVEKFPGFRLHVRAIIRDGRDAFLGSQSLGRVELDRRREVGVIVRDAGIVRRMQAIFERDWGQTGAARARA
jgi:cardiolipin synthase